MDANITNGQEARTHSCISLGPSGNIQSSLKCFDFETGKAVIRRRVVQLPFPNRIRKKANAWGKKTKAQITKDSIQFLNRMGEKFDWENDKVETIQVVRNDPEKTCFPCEICFTEYTFSVFSRCCAVSVLTQRTVDRVVLLAGGL